MFAQVTHDLEAAYLRGLVGTIPDAGERLALAQIAEAYERLADRLASIQGMSTGR